MSQVEAKQDNGLYRWKNFLIIDPEKVNFPLRCIYTNEPVESLSEIKLVQQVVRFGYFVSSTRSSLAIPISNTVKASKRHRSKIIGRFVLWPGVALMLFGAVVSILGRKFFGLAKDPFYAIVVNCIMFGFLFAVVGAIIPRLQDVSDPNVIYRVRFMKNGWLAISKANEMFLAPLPEWKPPLSFRFGR